MIGKAISDKVYIRRSKRNQCRKDLPQHDFRKDRIHSSNNLQSEQKIDFERVSKCVNVSDVENVKVDSKVEQCTLASTNSRLSSRMTISPYIRVQQSIISSLWMPTTLMMSSLMQLVSMPLKKIKFSFLKCLLSYIWCRITSKFFTTKFGIFFGFLLIISNILASVEAIRIESLVVPPYQKSGEGVQLECNYDLEGETLYSVRWYRGTHEFFRFTPGQKNEMQIFELPGVVVDTALSDSRKVTLRPVTRESSGEYRCEISADFPSFHTEVRSAEMLVVEFSNSVPNITGGRSRYHVGDEVHVNCTSAKSRPAASLMWYINSNQARSDELVEYAPVQDEDGLETSRLGLKFIVGAKDFPEGVLKIRCTATVAAVYWNSAETAVEGQLPQTSPALESKGVYNGGSRASRRLSSVGSLELFILIPLIQLALRSSFPLHR